MNSRTSYLQEIEHGVIAFKTHFQDIKQFVERYESRASAFFHAACAAPPESMPSHTAGLRDASALLERVGREHSWMVAAVVSAYTGAR